MNASIESGKVVALNKKSGEVAWEVEGINKSWTTPTIAKSASGRDELIISFKNEIRGLDPKSGRQLWSCKGIQDYVVPCVVVNDGIAYCIGGRKNQAKTQ